MTADIMMQNPSLYPEYEVPIVGMSSEEEQVALQLAYHLSNWTPLGCQENNYDDFMKDKKAQNMTECVPVPSSEHVAEIVGKQGCKIKALRAKTNTYIKTPVRGEEPVFVVTGRKEDVALARREVQSAAEHFTQIRASRNRHALLASQALGIGNGVGCLGTITLQVRVPYRVVGLVVGPKGATIKRIQQQTHTYIVTPSREKEPVFEVTGLPENVEKAKEEIEAHIAVRTGSQQTNVDDDFRNNGTEVGSPLTNPEYVEAAISAPFPSSSSSLMCNIASKSVLRSNAPSFYPTNMPASASQSASVFNPNQMPALPSQPAPIGVFSSRSSSDYFDNLEQSRNGIRSSPWSAGLSDTSNGSSYSFRSLFNSSSGLGCNERGNSCSPTSSLGAQFARSSPTFSDIDFPSVSTTSTGSFRFPSSRVASEESSASSLFSSDAGSLFSSAATPVVNIESGYSSGSATDSDAPGSPPENNLCGPEFMARVAEKQLSGRSQMCVICNESKVAVALVPCGHHLFCHACANKIVEQPYSFCPCCQVPAKMALPIKK